MSSFDPNKTAAFDPNRTIVTPAMPSAGFDPNRTAAMSAPPVGEGFDPNRTASMTGLMIPAGVSAEVIPSRTATMANGPAREQFLLEIRAAGAGSAIPGVYENSPRTPLNLCLVVDRSGSMEGAPLEYAKQACNYVVDLLGPNDVLSIVTFEEVVELLMPPQRVTTKEAIKAGISRLQAGNTTNLYDALAMGLQQILQTQDAGRATRMVVLSDGDPTAGIKDFASLVNHAGDIKSRGVTMTFLGFGPDYNEELLAAMARKSGGNYAYIPRPELIPEVFRLEVDRMMSVAATNLKLDVKLSRWVSLRGATGVSPLPTGEEFTMQLADLERGEVLQTVFDVEFPNHPLGHYRVLVGRLSYEDAMTGTTVSTDLDFVMEFSADASKYSAPADPRVTQVAQVAAASRAVEKTIMGLRTGAFNVTQALGELQKTQTLFLAEGRTQEAQEVTIAMRALQSGDASGAQKTLMGTVVNLDQGKSKNP